MPTSLNLYLIVQSLPDLFVLANQTAGKERVFSRSLVHIFASVHINIQVILYLISHLLALTHVSVLLVFRSITCVHHIIMNDTRKWLHRVLTLLVYFYMVYMYPELYNVIYLLWFNILFLRSGNIHPNLDPVANQFNICQWNLN